MDNGFALPDGIVEQDGFPVVPVLGLKKQNRFPIS
jgi:hypothetical protein